MKRKRENDKAESNSRKPYNNKNNVPTAQELQQYLNRNEVESIFVSVMESLCVDRPKNVPAYIVQYLQSNFLKQKNDRNGSVNHIQLSQTDASAPVSWSTFSFGARNEDDNMDQDEETSSINSYRIQSQSQSPNTDNHLDDQEDAPVSDVVSENIRRRYSIGGRRVGVSNESIDETTVDVPIFLKSDEDLKHIEDAITNCSMFSHLDSEDKSTISRAMLPRSYDTGDTIIHQGDEGSLFFVIDSGECEVFVNDELKKVLESGDSFGELALIHGTPRAATIKAKTAVNLWSIDRVTFRKVLMDATIKKRKLYGDFLRNVEILKTLVDYEIQRVADALVQETWKSGETIVKQNDKGHAFYIIEDGSVNVVKDDNKVATLKRGDYFGEMALMFDQPRAATVVASGDVKTVRLDRQSFKRLLGSCEDLLKRNMAVYNMIISKQI